MLGFDGRVNRGGFLLREIISFALMTPYLSQLGLAHPNGFLLLAAWVLFLAGFVVHMSACARRAHDFGWSGWTCLVFVLVFTPTLWISLWIYGWALMFPFWVMLLVRFNSGESNEHGQCPSGVEVGQ